MVTLYICELGMLIFVCVHVCMSLRVGNAERVQVRWEEQPTLLLRVGGRRNQRRQGTTLGLRAIIGLCTVYLYVCMYVCIWLMSVTYERMYVWQVFQCAIMEARKYKESGGDVLSQVLDLLSESDKVGTKEWQRLALSLLFIGLDLYC